MRILTGIGPGEDLSAMRKALRWATVVGLVGWSLLAWIAYGVVDFAGTGAASLDTVPGFRPEPGSFGALVGLLHGAGLSAVFVAWLVGTAMILGLSFLGHLIVSKVSPALPRRESFGSSIPNGQTGVHRSRGPLTRLLGR